MEKTDLTKWHLEVERGRQVWRYIPDQKPSEQKMWEKYFLGLDISKDAPPLKKPVTIKDSCVNAMDFWAKMQTEDGHWANDYGGPHFLLPGLVICAYVSGTELSQYQKTEIIRYLSNTQTKDGGWGLHVESDSTCFGTSLNYIVLRLLGLDRDDPRCVKARARLHSFGGATQAPHWGKFWMAVLGVFDWEGINAVLPELWLLPYKLPIHPGRWWCHCRVIYLPMAYLYGTKSTGTITKLIKELREEIFTEPYDKINWKSHRFSVAKIDLYHPHSLLVKTVFPLCNMFDKCAPGWLRQKALDSTLDHIRYEDKETNYIDIGPVNKTMDMLCEYFASGGKSEAFKKHQDRLHDYLWLAADGMKMQGYNGCQLWDTAFALQGIIETGLTEENEAIKECIRKAYHYVDITQVRNDATQSDKYYRHTSKGAWPFSTRDHGWPISDCTAEGFRAAVQTADACKWITPLEDQRLFDSVNCMLSYQNTDGGWPSYELKRGPDWVEYLNPAECFDNIMVDYSYVECSSACMRSLLLFKKHHPAHRTKEIDSALARGVQYIKNVQRADGSWHGSWAVCYTYAMWFGIEGLVSMGETNSEAVEKACNFLLKKQREDGAWGEDFKSCSEKRWVDNKDGHVVHTSWAVMSLMSVAKDDEKHKTAIRRGIKWIIENQLPNGDWKQPQICGVFNFNCAIAYEGYKNTFAIWALGRYINTYKYGSNLKITDL